MSEKKKKEEIKQVLADPKNLIHAPSCTFDYVNDKPCNCGVLKDES